MRATCSWRQYGCTQAARRAGRPGPIERRSVAGHGCGLPGTAIATGAGAAGTAIVGRPTWDGVLTGPAPAAAGLAMAVPRVAVPRVAVPRTAVPRTAVPRTA